MMRKYNFCQQNHISLFEIIDEVATKVLHFKSDLYKKIVFDYFVLYLKNVRTFKID
jgi:hypothetical protein